MSESEKYAKSAKEEKESNIESVINESENIIKSAISEIGEYEKAAGNEATNDAGNGAGNDAVSYIKTAANDAVNDAAYDAASYAKAATNDAANGSGAYAGRAAGDSDSRAGVAMNGVANGAGPYAGCAAGDSNSRAGVAMKRIEAFVHRLFADLPGSVRREELKLEIMQNLKEKVADLIEKGINAEDAVTKAFDDFGGYGDIADLRDELADGAREAKTKNSGLSLAFSVWGGILITALFIFINFYYTPRTIWFVYPVFAVAWWPMSMFFRWIRVKTGRRVGFAYSVCGFALFAALMLFINFYLTPRVIWSVYPIFGAVWWPLAMLFFSLNDKRRKADR